MTTAMARAPEPPIEHADRLHHLVDAVVAIGSGLSLPATLQRLVDAARPLIGARYAALGVLDEGGQGLSDFVYSGIDAATAARIGDPPEGRGILGLLIVEPRPLRLEDLRAHPDSYGFPAGHPPMTSFLGVPVVIREAVFGNLYLADKEGGTAFSPEDEALAVVLARAAAVAIENARLHGRLQETALLEDRERIAADLHDTVIQRLFATGLALEATSRAAPPDVAERIVHAVADLDETIRQVRAAIFALQAPAAYGRHVRKAVLAIAGELAASLGFEPHVRLEGPIDHAVDDNVAAHLLAVLREALTNVVRHARATHVEIDVRATTQGELVVTVADDGVGIGADGRGGGHVVENMARRAAELGGTFALGPGLGGRGTTVTWTVALAGT